eukprot:CAMPEP_0169189080 /NCGR_PEP_ID=MMETSP1016-20121227/3804_1 /TAXON_ID=342587 /ORGANISM="Karlodinium micrum, Strain CCMP2283" /LENGTH=145 /DNA_ID=CAMNT_0009265157 /DNA_START=326 /DNA_END=763 /DNA_ORIENTATION=+
MIDEGIGCSFLEVHSPGKLEWLRDGEIAGNHSVLTGDGLASSSLSETSIKHSSRIALSNTSSALRLVNSRTAKDPLDRLLFFSEDLPDVRPRTLSDWRTLGDAHSGEFSFDSELRDRNSKRLRTWLDWDAAQLEFVMASVSTLSV